MDQTIKKSLCQSLVEISKRVDISINLSEWPGAAMFISISASIAMMYFINVKYQRI